LSWYANLHPVYELVLVLQVLHHYYVKAVGDIIKGTHVLYYTINLGEAVKRDVANMTDELWDILGLMGKECEKYYV
jgi:CobQ-like glutamine amidotransferase family enzyme